MYGIIITAVHSNTPPQYVVCEEFALVALLGPTFELLIWHPNFQERGCSWCEMMAWGALELTWTFKDGYLVFQPRQCWGLIVFDEWLIWAAFDLSRDVLSTGYAQLKILGPSAPAPAFVEVVVLAGQDKCAVLGLSKMLELQNRKMELFSMYEALFWVHGFAASTVRDKSVAMFVSSGYSAQIIIIPIPLERGDSKLSRALRSIPKKAIHAEIHPILSKKCIATLLSLTGEIVKSDLLMGLRA
ncbi:hypothetical protein F5J12DRAFT_784773 [Pisolithus orientalis]|uniref:uncharacterized protein n=1 Tax=Pisolithus orientalis TaxID=936130 RepID=UPI0022247E58|nr:uncharacterized protein F5J12DRAFT_784773 [Pisolithus orientalis]KAI5998925.1 hypothetical protein F5J12DRAFT_784773 [Pisolithus orientalis]